MVLFVTDNPTDKDIETVQNLIHGAMEIYALGYGPKGNLEQLIKLAGGDPTNVLGMIDTKGHWTDRGIGVYAKFCHINEV